MFDIKDDEAAAPPDWVDEAAALVGIDPSSGRADPDRALSVMAWIGRQLFTASRADGDSHTRAGLETQVNAAQAVINTVSAVQVVRIAQFAATDSVTDGTGEDTRHPLGHRGEWADVDLAPGMCWSPRQATNRVDDAVDAVTRAPRLLEEMGAGRIDPYRLCRVTQELLEAGPGTCELVQDRLLDNGVTGWTPRQCVTRTRALVRRLDPPAARKTRAKRANQSLGVFARPGVTDGTTELTAVLRSSDAAAAYRAIDQLARALHESTTTDKTLAQCRADAIVDLILGNTSITTELTLLVPVKSTNRSSLARPPTDRGAEAPPTERVQSAAADGAEPAVAGPSSAAEASEPALGDAVLSGIGVIPEETIRAMVRDLGTGITRALVDQDTGSLLTAATRAYRPSAEIRRMVALRDQHCRFPACGRPARYCDADHVTPWPAGETTAGNLQLLCRHHHRAKHEAGWTVAMTREGTCTWTSPTGRSYITAPGLTDVMTPTGTTVRPGAGQLPSRLEPVP